MHSTAAYSQTSLITAVEKKSFAIYQNWDSFIVQGKKRYDKKAANYRVYRFVKSMIDYHKDDAITHPLKMQRRVPRSFSWSLARRLRVAGVCQALLYIKSINKRTRVYLHFGARNAIHFISVLFRIAFIHMYLAAMNVYRNCRIVFFVNFNKHRVNAKLARVVECIKLLINDLALRSSLPSGFTPLFNVMIK